MWDGVENEGQYLQNYESFLLVEYRKRIALIVEVNWLKYCITKSIWMLLFMAVCMCLCYSQKPAFVPWSKLNFTIYSLSIYGNECYRCFSDLS